MKNLTGKPVNNEFIDGMNTRLRITADKRRKCEAPSPFIRETLSYIFMHHKWCNYIFWRDAGCSFLIPDESPQRVSSVKRGQLVQCNINFR